jgi:transcriptional regulator with XRE-family HTH domain
MQDIATSGLASRVRELRQSQGKTQQTLATEASIALRTLASLEGGQDVSLESLRRIAQALGVTVSDLLTAA